MQSGWPSAESASVRCSRVTQAVGWMVPACSSCSRWQTSSRCPPVTSWPCCTLSSPTCQAALSQVSASPCYSNNYTLDLVDSWWGRTCDRPFAVPKAAADACGWLCRLQAVGLCLMCRPHGRAVTEHSANMYTSIHPRHLTLQVLTALRSMYNIDCLLMPSCRHAFEMIASSTFASKQVVWLLGVGQPPVAMSRMRPPSLMPLPPWLVEQRPHSQLPAGQLNLAGIPAGNHAFPYTLDSSQRQSAGLLRPSQVLPRNSMMHLF